MLNVMAWQELRYIFRLWPVEAVNQLYIELWEAEEQGFY